MAQLPASYLPFPAPMRQPMDQPMYHTMNPQSMNQQPIPFQVVQQQQQHHHHHHWYPSGRTIPSEYQHEAFMQPQHGMQRSFNQNQYPRDAWHYQQNRGGVQSVGVPQFNHFVPSFNSVPSQSLDLHLNLNMMPNPATVANQMENVPVSPLVMTPTVSSSSLTPPLSTPSLSPGPRFSASSRSSLTQQTSMQKRFIVFFDWDDTLFPTSSIIHKEESNVTAHQLYQFGKAAYELLNEYITIFGECNLYIVTNGARDWVLTSLQDLSAVFRAKARKISSKINTQFSNVEEEEKSHVLLDDNATDADMDYFAAIHNSIISLGIDVISAQHLHAERYPQQSTLWKTMVFKKVVKDHFRLQSRKEDMIYTIISIGDSEHEFVAAHQAKLYLDTGNRMNRCNSITHLHRIKLKSRPKMAKMLEQMKDVTHQASVFYQESGSSTIHYE